MSGLILLEDLAERSHRPLLLCRLIREGAVHRTSTNLMSDLFLGVLKNVLISNRNICCFSLGLFRIDFFQLFCRRLCG